MVEWLNELPRPDGSTLAPAALNTPSDTAPTTPGSEKRWLGATGASPKTWEMFLMIYDNIWAMVNTHYMVDGHPIHNKDPYNG